MDALVSSLPETTAGTLCVYYESASDEGNVCTKSQVAAIKAKGWTPLYISKEWNWLEYGGIDDDEAAGIALPELVMENGDAPVYNLAGQKVTSPVKGGIYIVGGKKVVVK